MHLYTRYSHEDSALFFADCKIIAWLALSIALCSTLAHAQSPSPFHLKRNWGPHNGLPDSVVTNIAQTTDGFIWLTTPENLFNFDGQIFENIAIQESPNTLFTDSLNNLWVSFLNQSGASIGNSSQNPPPHFRSSSTINTFASKGNQLWYGTTTGLMVYEDGVTTNITLETTAEHIVDLAIRNNTLWLAGSSGVRYLNIDNPASISSLPIPADSTNSYALLVDTQNRLWIATSTQLWMVPDNSITPVSVSNLKVSNSLINSQKPALDLQEAPDGSIWLLKGNSLSRYKYPTLTPDVQLELTNYLAPNSQGLQISSFLVDYENSVWIGTNKAGLYQLTPSLVSSYNTSNARNFFYSLTNDNSDGIWASISCNNTLFHFSATAFLNTYISPDHEVPLDVDDPFSCVRSIIKYSKGGYLVGHGKNISSYENGRVTRIYDKSDLKIDEIYTLFEDSNGKIWAGGTEGIAVAEQESLVGYDVIKNEALTYVRVITEDNQNNILFSSGPNLFRFNGSELKKLIHNPLYNSHIRAVYSDNDGVIWVGTYGSGLLVIENDKVSHISIKDGLIDNTVSQILEDDNNNLWLSGNRGISRVDKDNILKFLAGEIDFITPILLGSEVGAYEGSGGANPSYLIDSNKNLWFPNILGVTRVTPNSLAYLDDISPRLGTLQVFVDGQSFSADQPIILPTNTESISFQVKTQSYINPANNIYRFKLEGHDEKWINAGASGTVTYSDLSPGDYSFRFLRANSLGLWASENRTFIFTIAKPFYLQAWVYFLGLFLIFGFIWLVTNSRKANVLVNLSESEAIENDDTYQFFIERSSFPVIIFDFNTGLCTNCNEAACELLGFSDRSEIVNQSPMKFSPSVQPDGKSSFELIEYYNSQVQKYGQYDCIWQVVHAKTKEKKLLHLNFFVNRKEDRNSFLVTLKDISHIEALKEQLKTSEERFRILVEGLKDEYFFYSMNSQGRLIYISPSVKNIAGYEPSDIIGKRAVGFLTKNPLNKTAIQISNNNLAGIQHGKTFHGEIYHPIKKSSILLEFLHTLVFNGDKLERIDAVAKDVTLKQKSINSLKMAYEQISDQRKQLEVQASQLNELNEQKSRFFTNLSHDLKTPLTLISGPIKDLIAQSDELSNNKELELALRNVNHLHHLISKMLEYAQFDAGQFAPLLKKYDFIQFLTQIQAVFSPLAQRNNIKFELENNLPQQIVECDIHYMERVFSNLLSNAFKFTPVNGSVLIKTKLKLDVHNVLQVCITNTGEGISPQALPFIFDRFYREKHTTYTPGSGIGLSFARELMQLQHGNITASSNHGKDASFTVNIPIPDSITNVSPMPSIFSNLTSSPAFIDPTLTVREHLENQKELPINSENESIEPSPLALIVDDNPDLRYYIGSHLKADYRVMEASNGQEAFQIVDKTLPDIIICDLMMPLVDGISLIEKLKSSPTTSFIPIILLTADSSHSKRIAALKAGADDFLIKPFHTQELLLRVKNLVNSRIKLLTSSHYAPRQSTSQPHIQSDDEAFIERVIVAIETHLNDPKLNVEKLANITGQSRSKLHRKLKAIQNLSPSELIRIRRLEKASQLIEARVGTISEIAYGVGFKSVSHFSRVYRERYGHPPSAHLDSE